jgi:hypothetical protein
MKNFEKIYYCVFISFLIFSCSKRENRLQIQIKKLNNYPSASAIEYYDGKLYLMGDDATNLLVLDTSLNIVDSIPIISYPGKRIPKDTKPDLEASALNADNLLLFGSGSLSPYRNIGWKYNLKTKDKDSINLEPLYLKAKELGIEQVNIEGACFVSGKLILVSRGHKGYPHNHFIITNDKFWESDSNLQISVVSFVLGDQSAFRGISGLGYAKESDKLIMTVSTEDTKSSYEDGAIGKSYLWIIDNISTKLNNKKIKRDRYIDLEYIDPHFKGQKIESVTVMKETDKLIYLALVADNDDGSSTVFKMSITKTISLAE